MSRQKVWFHWIVLIIMMFSFSAASTASTQGGDDTNVFDVETRSVIAALRGPQPNPPLP